MQSGNPQNQVTPSQNTNVYNQSAGAYNQALGSAANPTAMGDVQNYYNPYEIQVVDNTLNDLERSRQMATNQIGTAATQARAFGGDRHGIAEAETNRGFADRAANTAGQLRMQGFGNAQNMALQDAQLGLMQSQQQGNLANMGFGFGQSIGNQQAQQGMQQQMLNQALIDAGKQQYQGYANSPYQSLNALTSAIGAGQAGQGTTTASQQRGLFDYLSLGAFLYK
jgi:hypothetical protein